MEACLDYTREIFTELISYFKDNLIKAHLIEHVNYTHFPEGEVAESVYFQFRSYGQEYVTDTSEFYTRHLRKIISRMDNFHGYGDHLLLNKINHIVIAISKTGFNDVKSKTK